MEDTRQKPLTMHILFFGTYDAALYPRVQVWREGFRAHGDRTDELNLPLGLDMAQRVRILKHPWLLPILGLKLLGSWSRLWMMSRRTARPDVVAVGYMGHFDVHLARWIFRDRPIVLDHLISAADTAADRGVSSGMIRRLLRGLDHRALSAADICCVDTSEHLDLIPEGLHDKALVVPVGAIEAAFRPPVLNPEPILRVIFVGSYTPLQGAPIIGEAIRQMAERSARTRFTMVGAGQDLPATRKLVGEDPSVTWIDRVDPEQLPDLLAQHDLCLGIFGVGPKALRVVPNKVFQGAAAGCVIVTSDTAPQRRALGEDAVFVPPGDARALADALEALSADPQRVWSLREASFARAGRDFVPVRCVEPLREALLKKTGMDT